MILTGIENWWRIARLAVGIAILSGTTASPAWAEWHRAESDRFIVYSDGDERILRDYVLKLEVFDRILRSQTGLDINEAPPRKLPIYLVGRHSGLEQVRPGISENIAGFYSATPDDIFAIGIRTRREDFVLLHEYAHHFMLQNFAYGYPAWLVEGFAEYYMTAEIEPNRATFGKFNESRASWLTGGQWLPLADLLTQRPDQIQRHGETYYPLAWLVTHWFMSDSGRKAALMRYMLDVGQGADPVEAMENVTGLTIPELEQTLRLYVRGNLQYSGFRFDFPRSPVVLTTLPPSADDLLLLNQRLKMGVRDDDRQTVLDEVRRLAGLHGDDPFARRILARVEITMGDRATGEAILRALIARDPEDVEALQLMARSRLEATDDPISDDDGTSSGIQDAMGYLRQAYAIDPENYLTLYLLSQVRQQAPGYPTDNDITTLAEAYRLAPQLDAVRFAAAQALMYRDRNADAINLLLPVANAPHGGGAAALARNLIRRAQGGQSGPDEGLEESDDVSGITTPAHVQSGDFPALTR